MKDDMISRQAALDALNGCTEIFLNNLPPTIYKTDAVEAVTALPPAQPGWIPCGEKEPTESGNYLLYRPHFWGAYEGQTTVCYWNGEFWSDDYCSEAERSLPVIEGMFWMPLPEPWKGGQDDNT